MDFTSGGGKSEDPLAVCSRKPSKNHCHGARLSRLPLAMKTNVTQSVWLRISPAYFDLKGLHVEC